MWLTVIAVATAVTSSLRTAPTLKLDATFVATENDGNVTLALTAAAVGNGVRDSSGATAPHIRHLRAAFDRFDRDGDGRTSRQELSLGLLSSVEDFYAPARHGVYLFGESQCANPTLDALSFAECAVAVARRGGNGTAAPPLSYDTLVRDYIQRCPLKLRTATWWDGESTCFATTTSSIAARKTVKTVAGSSAPAFILISSDWHVEPWYQVGTCPGGAICRFPNADTTNMFSCRKVNETTATDCVLNGASDPPYTLEESHFASVGQAKATVHFFVGDLQAHTWAEKGEGPPVSQSPAAIAALNNRVLAADVARFGANNVVWAAGNNDGPHEYVVAHCTAACFKMCLVPNNDISFEFRFLLSLHPSTLCTFPPTRFARLPSVPFHPLTYSRTLALSHSLSLSPAAPSFPPRARTTTTQLFFEVRYFSPKTRRQRRGRMRFSSTGLLRTRFLSDTREVSTPLRCSAQQGFTPKPCPRWRRWVLRTRTPLCSTPTWEVVTPCKRRR